jgi:hypothetical protein
VRLAVAALSALLSLAELMHDPTHRRVMARSRCKAVAPGSHNLTIVIGAPSPKVAPGCSGLMWRKDACHLA